MHFSAFQFRLLATKLFEVHPDIQSGGAGESSKTAAATATTELGREGEEDSSSLMDQDIPATKPSSKHTLRNELFEKLSGFYPDYMTHPRNNLLDLIPYTVDLS